MGLRIILSIALVLMFLGLLGSTLGTMVLLAYQLLGLGGLLLLGCLLWLASSDKS